MRIIIPTERERKANYSYAWTGYRLDPVIEEAEMQRSFHVSGWQFTQQTIERLGIRYPNISTRQGIIKAFSKAHEAIVKEICEMHFREVK